MQNTTESAAGKQVTEEARSKVSRKEFLKKMSAEYEARGLSEVNVDNLQIGALHTENNRERKMNESLQEDVAMLKAQLVRAEEVRVK